MSYDCPHCGAVDSTRCEKLEPVERYKDGRYPEVELEAARAVGCRVAHYVDLRAKSTGVNRPTATRDWSES